MVFDNSFPLTSMLFFKVFFYYCKFHYKVMYRLSLKRNWENLIIILNHILVMNICWRDILSREWILSSFSSIIYVILRNSCRFNLIVKNWSSLLLSQLTECCANRSLTPMLFKSEVILYIFMFIFRYSTTGRDFVYNLKVFKTTMTV